MFKFFNNTAKNSRFWWKLITVWTLIVYVAMIFNFVKNGLYDKDLDALLVIYIAILAIYAGDKEFERWHDNHSGRHPGEIFVFLWTVLIVGIGISQFIFEKTNGGLTSDVVAAYIAVLSVLAVTRRSRAIYERRRRLRRQ